MGEAKNDALRVTFDPRLRLEFHGASVTSDAGLVAHRELDEVFGLTAMVEPLLADPRTGDNTRHSMTALTRQSVYGRLAGYEDTNDAERVRFDPAARAVVGGRARDKEAASTSEMGWFETEALTQEENLRLLMDLPGQWIDRVRSRTGDMKRLILDMDSSESETYGDQQGSAYNGPFPALRVTMIPWTCRKWAARRGFAGSAKKELSPVADVQGAGDGIGGRMADENCLCVMTDDFGLHPAVNEGVVECFENGVLTDTNVMTVCEGFKEAARLVLQHRIPTGLHATFCLSFDRYVAKPITPMKTMVTPEGNFRDLVEDAWKDADMDEAAAELRAQHDAACAEGIDVAHLSTHMGVDEEGRFCRLLVAFANETDIPWRGSASGWHDIDAFPILRYHIDGVIRVSAVSTDFTERKKVFREKLFALGPGYHMWVTHVAADHPSLDGLTSPGHRTHHWGRTYRALDRRLVLDDDVRGWIDELGLELVPVTEFPLVRP